MKILITGHKGFIGSYLWKMIEESGVDVELNGIDFPDDIGDFNTGEIYDVVIHLAAFAALRESFENPDRFWENNVEKSQPIFDYCKECDVRLLYASSAGAHGWWQNPYAITKKVNEIQAPPPVEMCSIPLARPIWLNAIAVSPPPTTVIPSLFATF